MDRMHTIKEFHAVYRRADEIQEEVRGLRDKMKLLSDELQHEFRGGYRVSFAWDDGVMVVFTEKGRGDFRYSVPLDIMVDIARYLLQVAPDTLKS
jgi:hypothetical protein